MHTASRCAFVVTIVMAALVGCQAQPVQPASTRAGSLPAVAEPDYWPTGGWNSSTPEQQGMDSGKLAAMFDAIERDHLNLHSVIVIRNGYVVAEAYFSPYDATYKQQLASVTKSVSGMLTGIAIEQGKIENTNQPVLSFFPNRTVANVDQNKRNLTLEHLLTLTTGLTCSDDAGTLGSMLQSRDWVQFTLDLPMAGAPGGKFSYCSPAVHLVTAILGQATGKNVRELANETLFAPLGIPAAGKADWSADPQGIVMGYAGLSLTPRDMAKLGFLYLHGGRWQGRQVIPASWVAASLAPHAADGSGRNYGYLFWIYGQQGYYSALGLGGQDIHIIPAKNLVVVFTAAMDIPTHDSKVITLLDDYVVPAAASAQPLPANPASLAQLQDRIHRAGSPQVSVPALPAVARAVSGKVYRMDDNPNGWQTLSLTFQDGSPEAVVTIDGSRKLLIGLDNVYRTTVEASGLRTAMRGRWEAGDRFVIDNHTPGDILQWQFQVTYPDDQMLVDVREQVRGASANLQGRLAR